MKWLNQPFDPTLFLIFSIGLTLCNTEQPLEAIKWQEKEWKNIKAYRKSVQKKTTDKRCLLILDT